MVIRLNQEYTDRKEISDKTIDILFEFVIHVQKNERVIPLSCGWASESLDKLIDPKMSKFKLLLKGGTPQDVFEIRDEDVLTGRKGFAANMGKMVSGKVASV